MNSKQPIIILTGPTAVGKTDIADKLAQMFPVEIINADMGQMYEPLTIGTAKPDWKSSAIRHHGFDILNEPHQYTVVAYRQYVMALCQEIWTRNKTPLLVGGSLFYIKSLFFPPKALALAQTPKPLPEDQSWQGLYELDPVRAQAIHPNDTYRIQRAFAVWSETGGSQPSTYVTPFQPFCDALIIFANRERQELYARINERVVAMFEQGLLQEVTKLQATAWEPFLLEKKLIGYDDCLRFLVQPHSSAAAQDLLIEIIQHKTRKYAKRQITFWNMLQKMLTTAQDPLYKVTTTIFDLTNNDDALYSSNLMECIHTFTRS